MRFSPIDFERELNHDQYAAVAADDGPALVLAGAGSGKTRTLTYRVAWLLLERGVHPGEIMLLTFTNKAAREMIERVMDLTGLQRPPGWSGTFHSIGGRILRVHGEHVGLRQNYTIMDADDSDSLLTQVIKEADSQFLKDKDNPKPRVIGDLISYARNTEEPLRDVVSVRMPWASEMIPAFERFFQLYTERKREQQVVDYDDLLVLWMQLLDEQAEVRETLTRRFRYLLVDEYQDTNRLQARIIDKLGSHHNIMAVGDDAQCIYTWRGAEFENIRSFPERHPGTRIFKIVRNYRSTPQILSLANSVLMAQPAGSGYEKELIADREDSVLPYVVPVLDTRHQARFLVNRIEGLYQEGYGLRDIAILYRAHFQALDAQLELSRSSIPFTITSGMRFFEQAHVKDLVAQIRVVINPQDRPALDRLLQLLPKIGPATVAKIIKAAQDIVAEESRPQQEDPDLFESPPSPSLVHASVVTALGDERVVAKVPKEARAEFVQMVASLNEMHDLVEAARQETEGVRPEALVDLGLKGWYGDYIRTVYPNWESRREDLEGLIGFATRFATVSEFLAQIVLMNSETNEKSIEVDDESVLMTTIHQAKGLEFPVVFVLGCAEELFPLRRSIESGDVEEERRLFYVAVTRARDELYLCYPMLNAGRGGGPLRLDPSRFLREIPSEKFEKLNVSAHPW